MKFNLLQNLKSRRLSRWLVRLAFIVGCLVTVAALFYSIENWRGRRAWEKYRKEWEARGEKFDLAAFVPPPVPDDQNFAMTPLFKPLFDYRATPQGTRWNDTNGVARVEAISVYYPDDPRGKIAGKPGKRRDSPRPRRPELTPFNRIFSEEIDLKAWQAYYRDDPDFPTGTPPQSAARDVLLALGKFDAELNEIALASQRPGSRFPLHYDEMFKMAMKHLQVLRQLQTLFVLRAIARLQSGELEPAAQDVLTGLRLVHSLQIEPTLVSQFTRAALLRRVLQPVWEGLIEHRWSENQLVRFQAELKKMDFPGDCARAMRVELAFINSFVTFAAGNRAEMAGFFYQTHGKGPLTSGPLALCVRFSPWGWDDQNRLAAARFWHGQIFSAVNTDLKVFDPEKSRRADTCLDSMPRTLFNWITRVLTPVVGGIASRFAFAQTCADEAQIACALERYRLIHKAYPGNLEVLVPNFMENLPHDVIGGKALNYRLDGAERYILYSVGWNMQDDGGTVGDTSPSVDCRYDGDWVWQNFSVPDKEKQSRKPFPVATGGGRTTISSNLTKRGVKERMDALKMIGAAVMRYADQHQKQLPASLAEVKPHLAPEVAERILQRVTYLGKGLTSMDAINNPSQTLSACDRESFQVGKLAMFLFADGHVEGMEVSKALELLKTEYRRRAE